jgi:hypothetical protein
MDLEYENNNIIYNDDFTKEDGGGIKCKNYKLCNAILPKWWFSCKNNYLCINCHIIFGTWKFNNGKGILEFINNIECPICLEYKESVSQPNCNHFICIDCCKRCYYGDESGEPLFPYPDIEEEYYDDLDNPKWKIEYPLIDKYEKDYDIWDEDKYINYEKETFLQKCPLCRK